MGVSTDGILAYGFDLGEDFGFDWDREDVPAWVTDEDDEAAENVLLAANGFTEPEPDGDAWIAWHDRRTAALEQLGVELIAHCSDRAPMYLLAAKSFENRRGDAVAVDFNLPENAAERLAWAVDVLGLTKFQGQAPRWLLASMWSPES